MRFFALARRPLRAALLVLLLPLSAAAALPATDSQGQPLPTLAPMLERVLPGVVNIATTATVPVADNPLLADPFFREFFNLPAPRRRRQAHSLGSGVVVDAGAGYILTNHHVIDKADEITVTLHDGRSLTARLVGADPETDVAVIQVEAVGLTAIPMADSDQVRVGDFVVAIGNPFGLGQTVTSGIVSAVGRSGLGIEGYEDFIQTDASINPGNSGGALVNLRGELVGINTAILSRSGGNVGIGFAIPIRMAAQIMRQLIEHGAVQRGALGAQAQDLTPALAQAFGIGPGVRGAVITRVRKGSAAARAGLKPGDVVVAINGRPVSNANALRTIIGLLEVGTEVKLRVLRDGRDHTITARVEPPRKPPSHAGGKLHPHLAGARLMDADEMDSDASGVLVAEVAAGSPAAAAGLRPGDLITAANRRVVRNVAELAKAVRGRRALLLNLRRGNASLFLYLR